MTNAFSEGVQLGARKTPRLHQCSRDPVIARVRDWIVTKDLQDALTHKWQDAEHRLSIMIRPLGIDLSHAVHGDLPEAKSMRGLMRRIKATDRQLERAATQIATMQSTSPFGALAKIEMALRFQHPLNCEDLTWALLASGAEELHKSLPSDRQIAA